LETDFRQRQKAVRPVEPAYPSTVLEKQQWIVDKPLGRTKLQSEARLIAGAVIEKADLEIDADQLATLIEHGLHEMRTRIFPRRDEGDFSDEINDRIVKEALRSGPASSPTQPAEVAKASGPGLGKSIERFLAEHNQAISTKTGSVQNFSHF